MLHKYITKQELIRGIQRLKLIVHLSNCNLVCSRQAIKCITNVHIQLKASYYIIVGAWLVLLTSWNCSTGIANSQNGFKCGPVCLLAELSCSCEVTNTLGWRLLDLNMQQVGQGETFSTGANTAGVTEQFADGHFTATLTDITEMTLTSVASGTIRQTTDGYTLQCFDGTSAIVGGTKISIPGRLIFKTVTSQAVQTNVCIVLPALNK